MKIPNSNPPVAALACLLGLLAAGCESAGPNQQRGAAGGAMGRAQDNRNEAYYTSEEQASTNLYVAEAPPPPPLQSEAVTPRPTGNAVWVSGYWAYDSGRNLWTPGHWEIPPGRYTSNYAPHWRRHPNGYVYVRGYWR